MDNAFPYSTDAPGLMKNFHPFRMRSPSRKRPDLEYARHCDAPHPTPNMNTPRFPTSIFAPAEYGMDYQLTAPRIQGYVTKNKEGYYMDVFGRQAKTNLNFPYVLQVYTPRPFEETFQTKESALTRVPKTGDWQIINVFTGQHVYAPYRRNNHSFMC